MPDLVLATSNPHKVEELRAILGAAGLTGFRILGLNDIQFFRPLREPEETGATFEENATIKARAYASQTHKLCLADDSGLEIDALEGRPGVISSHYATDGRETGLARAERDAANNARVLRELEGVPPEARAARFVCVMVLAAPPGWKTSGKTSGTGFQPVSGPPPTSGGLQPVTHPLIKHLHPCSLQPIHQAEPGPLKISRGDLPHWHQDGRTYFVTFRVKEGKLSAQERQIVLDACLHWHRERALVHLVVVMPDHVHLLLSPLPDAGGAWHQLSEIIHSIKSFAAKVINRGRGSSGALWQPEYFDRIPRGAIEFDEKWNYMIRNPVTAGLVANWYEYPWTSGGSVVEARLTAAEPEVPPERTGTPHRLEAGATAEPAVLFTTRGAFEGRIGIPPAVPRGTNGFGYDPLFLAGPGFEHTSAELPTAEKNRLSHRGIAAREMARALRELAPNPPPG